MSDDTAWLIRLLVCILTPLVMFVSLSACTLVSGVLAYYYDSAPAQAAVLLAATSALASLYGLLGAISYFLKDELRRRPTP